MLLNVFMRARTRTQNLFLRPFFQCDVTPKKNYGKCGHYDIVIIGGGASGLSLAGSISKTPVMCDKKILLLDAAPEFKGYNKDIYSNRVYALNQTSVNLLKTIGAWDTIKSIRCRAVKQMQVWDSYSDALITFNHEDFVGELAYIVENDVLIFAILNELKSNTNLNIKNATRINGLMFEGDGRTHNEIHLATGEVISADLIVGADGVNSLVRKQMNVNHFEMSYGQMGLVATVQIKDCENNFVAWQRFLPNGVIAFLPLSDQLSSIVWSTDTEHYKFLMQLTDDDFIHAINNAFIQEYKQNPTIKSATGILKDIFKIHSHEIRQLPPRAVRLYQKSRAGFPLGFAHSSSYVNQGVALIGDAAHRIHPLAGLGLNLGMGDVKYLTKALEQSAFSGSKLNDLRYLRGYEKQSLRNNVPVMLGVHGLHRMYNTNSNLVILARTIGLKMAHKMAPLKNFFMERAMR